MRDLQQATERQQRIWDEWREEIRAGFDTADLEEDCPDNETERESEQETEETS
jgi:hypothetical protein